MRAVTLWLWRTIGITGIGIRTAKLTVGTPNCIINVFHIYFFKLAFIFWLELNLSFVLCFHTENSNQLFGLSLKKYFKHPKYFIQPFSPSSFFSFLLLFNWIDLLDGTNFFAPCLPSASILNLFGDCLFGEFMCLTGDIGFLLNVFSPSKRESM